MGKAENILDAIRNLENRESFYTVLKDFGLTQRICELGLRDGYNLIHLLNCNPDLAVGIDLWQDTGNVNHNDLKWTQDELDEQYRLVIERIGFKKNTLIVRSLTSWATRLFPDEFFDLVYIDADHSYEGCSQDIKSWYPKVKNGGILAGHDYPGWGTVIRAVDEFVAAHDPGRFITNIKTESWFCLKE